MSEPLSFRGVLVIRFRTYAYLIDDLEEFVDDLIAVYDRERGDGPHPHLWWMEYLEKTEKVLGSALGIRHIPDEWVLSYKDGGELQVGEGKVGQRPALDGKLASGPCDIPSASVDIANSE